MCEYNENHTHNDKSAEIVYSPEVKYERAEKKRSHLLTGAAFVICMAVTSAATVFICENTADNDYDFSSESKADVTAAQVHEEGLIDKTAETAVSADNSAYKSVIELTTGNASLTVPEIVCKVKPSVVGISSEFTENTVSTGTGIIISSDGYIVTNAHVVQNSDGDFAERSNKVTVVLSDMGEYDAEIVGADSRTDLAIVKISADGTQLPAAEFGSSENLTEGELAIAIGNPLGFELYGSTTCGIISALNRKITVGEYEMTLIQTDAAINPGNSGGPLLNEFGQVIGINSSKIISDYAEGLGFAIPISSAKPIIDDIIENGYVTGRAMLGISGEDISELTARYYNLPQGVCVRFITPDSAAEKSGIEVGDIIIGIDGESITSMSGLNGYLAGMKAGETVKLTVYRSDTQTQCEIDVILDEDRG